MIQKSNEIHSYVQCLWWSRGNWRKLKTIAIGMEWLPRFPKFVGLAPSSIDKDPSSKWSPHLGSLQLGCISHQQLKSETWPNIFNFSEDFNSFLKEKWLRKLSGTVFGSLSGQRWTHNALVTSDAFTAPTRRNRHDSRQKQCHNSGWRAHDDFSSLILWWKSGKIQKDLQSVKMNKAENFSWRKIF